MKIAIRPPYTQLDLDRLMATAQELTQSQYKRWAIDAEAPTYTDCITAIRYICHVSSDFVLPHAFIWDMAQTLLASGPREISLQSVEAGDLIFFERMSFTHGAYMIAHVGIMVSSTEFFHSSLHFAWWKISLLSDIAYNPLILDESYLDIASDPRHHV